MGTLIFKLKPHIYINSTIEKEKARLFDRMIVPILKKFDPSQYLRFGKNVMVIGEKI